MPSFAGGKIIETPVRNHAVSTAVEESRVGLKGQQPCISVVLQYKLCYALPYALKTLLSGSNGWVHGLCRHTFVPSAKIHTRQDAHCH